MVWAVIGVLLSCSASLVILSACRLSSMVERELESYNKFKALRFEQSR